MRYRFLGATELQVSAIGFGASPLGNVFGNVTVEDGRSAVRTAIDHGVNFFDVSPYYGLTLAEERLGDALHTVRQNVVLATKCGRYGTDRFDFSPQTITFEFEQSLRRLRTDQVDLLQAHDVEFGDIRQIVEETIPTMRLLQQQGKTRYIGITSYWPGLLARIAQEVSVDSVLSYCHSNLMMDDMDLVLTPIARVGNIGLINASPLHMGLLGGTEIPAWHPAPAEVRRIASEVVELCRVFSVKPSTVALHACLQHPVAASTLVGMGNVAHVLENCTALDFQPDPDLMAAIRACITGVFNTSWLSGLAENQDLPLPVAAK